MKKKKKEHSSRTLRDVPPGQTLRSVTFSEVTAWAATTTADFRTHSSAQHPRPLSRHPPPGPQLPTVAPGSHRSTWVTVGFPIGDWLLGYFHLLSE